MVCFWDSEEKNARKLRPLKTTSICLKIELHWVIRKCWVETVDPIRRVVVNTLNGFGKFIGGKSVCAPVVRECFWVFSDEIMVSRCCSGYVHENKERVSVCDFGGGGARWDAKSILLRAGARRRMKQRHQKAFVPWCSWMGGMGERKYANVLNAMTFQFSHTTSILSKNFYSIRKRGWHTIVDTSWFLLASSLRLGEITNFAKSFSS